jgi:hypothetical protein
MARWEEMKELESLRKARVALLLKGPASTSVRTAHVALPTTINDSSPCYSAT